MASAGRILIMPKGDYNAETQYEMLDLVSHNGTSWLAKKTVKGIEPKTANKEYWQNMMGFDPSEYLKKTGGVINGSIKFQRTFDDAVVATELEPGSYKFSENRASTIVHFRDGTSKAMVAFNEDGIGLRNNVSNVFYPLYGEHNADTLLKTKVVRIIEEYINNHS